MAYTYVVSFFRLIPDKVMLIPSPVHPVVICHIPGKSCTCSATASDLRSGASGRHDPEGCAVGRTKHPLQAPIPLRGRSLKRHRSTSRSGRQPTTSISTPSQRPGSSFSCPGRVGGGRSGSATMPETWPPPASDQKTPDRSSPQILLAIGDSCLFFRNISF